MVWATTGEIFVSMTAILTASYEMSITSSYRPSLKQSRGMNKHERNVFARNLQSAIDNSDLRGKTQKEIGDAFKTSGPMVSVYLSGAKIPRMGTAIRMAKRLNVCVEWLLTGRGPRTPTVIDDTRLSDLIAYWPNLDNSTRDAIHTIAKHRVHSNDPPPPDGKTSRPHAKVN